MQWNIERNGLPEEELVIRKLHIDEPLDEASLTIPADIQSKFNLSTPLTGPATVALGNPGEPASELAPGIVFIAGSWNTTLIRQDENWAKP